MFNDSWNTSNSKKESTQLGVCIWFPVDLPIKKIGRVWVLWIILWTGDLFAPLCCVSMSQNVCPGPTILFFEVSGPYANLIRIQNEPTKIMAGTRRLGHCFWKGYSPSGPPREDADHDDLVFSVSFLFLLFLFELCTQKHGCQNDIPRVNTWSFLSVCNVYMLSKEWFVVRSYKSLFYFGFEQHACFPSDYLYIAHFFLATSSF